MHDRLKAIRQKQDICGLVGNSDIIIEMKKKKGIIETLKAATSEAEVVELTKKIAGFDQVSEKTIRKFTRISRRMRAKFRKNKHEL